LTCDTSWFHGATTTNCPTNVSDGRWPPNAALALDWR
jgi:hypothetical protein